jgi:hypothetical protein
VNVLVFVTLATFGRVMPVGMTLCVVLATSAAIDGSGPGWLSWPAAAAFAVAVVSTVAVNVPINIATGRWDPANLPAHWERTRRRWELFQGVRSWRLLTGFVLVCAAGAVHSA